MEKSLLIFSFLLLHFNGCSQGFEKTHEYAYTGADRQAVYEFYERHHQEEGKHMYLNIVLTEKPNEVLTRVLIEWPETYDSTYLEVWEEPGLKNVDKILKVQVEYAACCYNIHAHYFLITNQGDWIQVPGIEYVMCDWPADIEEYKVDANNSLLGRVLLTHNSEGKVVDSQLIESLYWDGEKLIAPH